MQERPYSRIQYWELPDGIGKVIAGWRIDRDVSKAEIARAIGLASSSHLTNIEKGIKKPSPELVKNLRWALVYEPRDQVEVNDRRVLLQRLDKIEQQIVGLTEEVGLIRQELLRKN